MAREYQPRSFNVEIVPVEDRAHPGLVGPRFFSAAESGMTHLIRVRLQFEGRDRVLE